MIISLDESNTMVTVLVGLNNFENMAVQRSSDFAIITSVPDATGSSSSSGSTNGVASGGIPNIPDSNKATAATSATKTNDGQLLRQVNEGGIREIKRNNNVAKNMENGEKHGTKYRCHICDKTFTDKLEVRQHFNDDHQQMVMVSSNLEETTNPVPQANSNLTPAINETDRLLAPPAPCGASGPPRMAGIHQMVHEREVPMPMASTAGLPPISEVEGPVMAILPQTTLQSVVAPSQQLSLPVPEPMFQTQSKVKIFQQNLSRIKENLHQIEVRLRWEKDPNQIAILNYDKNVLLKMYGDFKKELQQLHQAAKRPSLEIMESPSNKRTRLESPFQHPVLLRQQLSQPLPQSVRPILRPNCPALLSTTNILNANMQRLQGLSPGQNVYLAPTGNNLNIRQQSQSQPQQPQPAQSQPTPATQEPKAPEQKLVIPLLDLARLDQDKIKQLNQLGVASFIPLKNNENTSVGIPILKLLSGSAVAHFSHDAAVEIGPIEMLSEL